MPSKRGGRKISKSKKRKPKKKQRCKDNMAILHVTHSVKSLHLADTNGQTSQVTGIYGGLLRNQEVKLEGNDHVTDLVPKVDDKQKIALSGEERKLYRIGVKRCPYDDDEARELFVFIMKYIMSREKALEVLVEIDPDTDSYFANLTDKELYKLGRPRPDGEMHVYALFEQFAEPTVIEFG